VLAKNIKNMFIYIRKLFKQINALVYTNECNTGKIMRFNLTTIHHHHHSPE